VLGRRAILNTSYTQTLSSCLYLQQIRLGHDGRPAIAHFVPILQTHVAQSKGVPPPIPDRFRFMVQLLRVDGCRKLDIK